MREIGNHIIEIKLSDGIEEKIYTFTVSVINTSPKFSVSTLVDYEMNIGEVYKYRLPDQLDDEKLPIRVTLSLTGSRPLPSFINLQKDVILFSPSMPKHKGIYRLEVTLSDDFSEPNVYPFVLNVK